MSSALVVANSQLRSHTPDAFVAVRAPGIILSLPIDFHAIVLDQYYSQTKKKQQNQPFNIRHHTRPFSSSTGPGTRTPCRICERHSLSALTCHTKRPSSPRLRYPGVPFDYAVCYLSAFCDIRAKRSGRYLWRTPAALLSNECSGLEECDQNIEQNGTSCSKLHGRQEPRAYASARRGRLSEITHQRAARPSDVPESIPPQHFSPRTSDLCMQLGKAKDVQRIEESCIWSVDQCGSWKRA